MTQTRTSWYRIDLRLFSNALSIKEMLKKSEDGSESSEEDEEWRGRGEQDTNLVRIESPNRSAPRSMAKAATRSLAVRGSGLGQSAW